MQAGSYGLTAVAFAFLLGCGARRTDVSEVQAAPKVDASEPSSLALDSGAAATGSAQAPASASAKAAPDPCDALVAAWASAGGVGLELTDPSLDPVCQWRVDDANTQALVGSIGPGAGAALGHAGVQSSTGRVDPTTIKKAMKEAQAGVAACVKGIPAASPVLRVRVAFDGTGHVSSAITDYRLKLPATAVDCVTSKLRKLQLPSGRQTVVFGYEAPGH